MRAIACAAVLFIVAVAAGCGSSGGPVEGSGPATHQSGATVTAVSCPAPGECAAGGAYNSDAGYQPMVVSQANGSWGKAIEVPGMAALNVNRGARVTAISCAAPGECAAGGYYNTTRCYGSDCGAFVVSETNGSWGNAIKVPGVGGGVVNSISCGAPGDCAAGGYDYGPQGQEQAFVVTEKNGRWGDAIEVPGVAKLNPNPGGGFAARVNSISCAAAGECVAGGYSFGGAFVVSETNGSWGTAMKVPGTTTLNEVTSISCPAVGECAAGGDYFDAPGQESAFVVSERSGSWGEAIEVPGTAALGVGADVTSISCAAPGECAAGGYYDTGHYDDFREHAFVVSEANGTWGNAIEVPGTARIKSGCARPLRRCSGPGADVTSISCAAAGECAAGGAVLHRWPFRSTYPVNFPTFVVSETNGTWGDAVTVPGTATLNSISCAAAGECAAGGGYYKAFVVSATNGDWGNALRFK